MASSLEDKISQALAQAGEDLELLRELEQSLPVADALHVSWVPRAAALRPNVSCI